MKIIFTRKRPCGVQAETKRRYGDGHVLERTITIIWLNPSNAEVAQGFVKGMDGKKWFTPEQEEAILNFLAQAKEGDTMEVDAIVTSSE
jgi:hypothetical protein